MILLGIYVHWMQFFVGSLIGSDITWSVPSPLFGQPTPLPSSLPPLSSPPPSPALLWTPFKNTFWDYFVDTFCEHFWYLLWTLFVDTSLGHLLWKLIVDTFCEYFLWTLFVDTLCGHFFLTLFVDTCWQHFFCYVLCTLFGYNKLFSWNNG